MTLKQLEGAEKARVISITGGSKLRQKLALRGISEGTSLKVISSRGPITIKLNGNTVTVGRGMAKKIKVRKI